MDLGMTWLVQSTLVLAAGLVVARLVRVRGPALESAVLRATLLAVLVSPLVSALLGVVGVNGLGITTYAQIAAFSAEDIAKVDEALSFKGRIERDDWLSQAAELAKNS